MVINLNLCIIYNRRRCMVIHLCLLIVSTVSLKTLQVKPSGIKHGQRKKSKVS